LLTLVLVAPLRLFAVDWYSPGEGRVFLSDVGVEGSDEAIRFSVRLRQLHDLLFVVDEIEPLTPSLGYRPARFDTRMIDLGDADQVWLFVRMALQPSSCKPPYADRAWDTFKEANPDSEAAGRIDIWLHSPECFVAFPQLPQPPIGRSFALRRGQTYQLYFNGELKQTIEAPR